jgi:hypothetical protein
VINTKQKESNMSKSKVKFRHFSVGPRTMTLATQLLDEGHFVYGVSICHGMEWREINTMTLESGVTVKSLAKFEGDTFTKKRGNMIALGRLNKNANLGLRIENGESVLTSALAHCKVQGPFYSAQKVAGKVMKDMTHLDVLKKELGTLFKTTKFELLEADS